MLDRLASSRPPTVRLLSPRSVTGVGGAGLTVSWQASDPDGDALAATVEHAADGRSFRIVWQGPSRGSARIPAANLTASTAGRVRVTVRDGFAGASATSGVVRTAGRGPTATIDSPVAGVRHQAGSTVPLVGSAFDEDGGTLSGRSLTWFASKRRLGMGLRREFRLPAGRTLLRLVAVDRRGRPTVATRTITATVIPLTLTRIAAADTVVRRARTVTVTLATSVAATVTSGGRRFRLGTRARNVALRLPARPASGILRPGATITAVGAPRRTVRVSLVVYRR